MIFKSINVQDLAIALSDTRCIYNPSMPYTKITLRYCLYHTNNNNNIVRPPEAAADNAVKLISI